MTLPPPLPTPDPPVSGASPRRGWWERHWKWAVPLIAAAVFAAVLGVVGAAVLGMAGHFKASEPYRYSLARVRQDPGSIAHLGQPIEPDWMVNASEQWHGTGEYRRVRTSLSFNVSGPKGRGHVEVLAEGVGQPPVWRYRTLDLSFADGSAPLDLRPPREADAEASETAKDGEWE